MRPGPHPGVRWVEVDCPDCGNRNREARRRCKKQGGMCLGTGKVLKTAPTRDAVDRKPKGPGGAVLL